MQFYRFSLTVVNRWPLWFFFTDGKKEKSLVAKSRFMAQDQFIWCVFSSNIELFEVRCAGVFIGIMKNDRASLVVFTYFFKYFWQTNGSTPLKKSNTILYKRYYYIYINKKTSDDLLLRNVFLLFDRFLKTHAIDCRIFLRSFT